MKLVTIDTGEKHADARVHLLTKIAIDDYFSGPRFGFTEPKLRTVERGLKLLAERRPTELGWAIQSLFRFAAHVHLDRGEKREAYRLLRKMHVAMPAIERMNAPATELVRRMNPSAA